MTPFAMPSAPACPSLTIGELARIHHGRFSGAVGELSYLFFKESDAQAFRADLFESKSRSSTIKHGPLVFWVVRLSTET